MVAPGGHAWLLRGGMHGCSGEGGMRGCSGGMRCCSGGRGAGGVHGFIQGGMCGFIWGACMVLFRGVHGFFSFFGYNEIRSMSGGTHPTGMHSFFHYFQSMISKWF